MGLVLLERDVAVQFEQALSQLPLSHDQLPDWFRDAEGRPDGADGLSLSSFRTGFEVRLSSDRLVVREAHRDHLEGARLPQLVLAVVNALAVPIKAFGLNYQVEFSANGQKAGMFLARQLLNAERTASDSSLIGVRIQLIYETMATRYTLTLEPRWQDHEANNCYANLNVHYETEELGGQDRLVANLNDGFNWFSAKLSSLFPNVLREW